MNEKEIKASDMNDTEKKYVFKCYTFADAEFARLCGIEFEESSSEEFMVDENGRVINHLTKGKENED